MVNKLKAYRVILESYSSSTSFDIDLDKKELQLLKDIERATEGSSVGLRVIGEKSK